MTESSPPSTVRRGLPSSASELLRRAGLGGLAVAAGISASFGAYAYLAPATYVSSATVTMFPPAGEEPTLDPLEAELRLRSALVAPAATKSLEIETTDGRTFELTCRDGSAALAQKACSRLAHQAVERIPRLFAIERAAPEVSVDTERQRNAEALVALLAQHPELTAPAPAQRPSPEANDPIFKILRAERAALEARVATSGSEKSRTDNPYSDPASVDPEIPQVRRRLVQISKEMDARRELLERMNGSRPKQIPPELRARWQELLKAASAPEPARLAAPAPKMPRAVLAAEASLPRSPLAPNRPLLLLIGLLMGAGGGVLVVALRTIRASRSGSARDDELEHTASLEAPQPEATLGDSFAEIIDADLYPSPNMTGSGSDDDAPRDFGTDSLPDLANATHLPPPGESSAPAREPHTREISGIELVEHATQRAPGRVTQALGSPIVAELPRRSEPAPSFHPPGYRAPTGISTTQYSYVSAPPPADGSSSGRAEFHEIRPISTPPPPKPSSAPPAPHREPISEPRRISTQPSLPRSHITGDTTPRSIVTPRPAPSGWRPDGSLVPEARRALCDDLYPLAVDQCFVIGVSGVRGAGEDTARVSAELALALAETGHPRILLLEGNLQRPSIHRLMRVEMPLFAGFSEQLERRIQSGNQRGSWSVIACSPTLHVIGEGLMRVPELILSRQFEDAVNELRNYYDVIVIDGPLVSEVAACRAVQDVVDGVVLVCPRAGSHEIAEASALFSHKRFSTVLAAG